LWLLQVGSIDCSKRLRHSRSDYTLVRIRVEGVEQIKFLLGHSSIQTTERYLGSKQEIVVAVKDNLGL
jgi:hypothetical protein